MNQKLFFFTALLVLHQIYSPSLLCAQSTCTCIQTNNTLCLDVESNSAPQFSPILCVSRFIPCGGGWVCDPDGPDICQTFNGTGFRVTGDPIPYDRLINGGFEDPDILGNYLIFDVNLAPGWETTATDNKIEYWNSGFNGQPAYEGNQFAELNANQISSLYQEVTFVPAGLPINFTFAHAARGNAPGNDIMSLTITDLGTDQTYGTSDDTLLFQKQYFAPRNTSGAPNPWTRHSSATEPEILSLGNRTRFSFDSLSAGDGGVTFGNFLDAVAYSLNVPAGYNVYECDLLTTIDVIPI